MDERTDKLNTKKDSGQQMAAHCDSSDNKLAEGPDTSRRKFTRNVLVGSAVLLTLTNRSAWGASIERCVSTNLLMSIRNNGSMLTTEQQDVIDEYEYYLNRPDEYTVIKGPEPDGNQTCYKAVSPNGSPNGISDNTQSTFDNTESTFNVLFEKDPVE